MKKKVAIIGGTGFVGMELFRLLENHPYFVLDFISSESKKGKSINHQYLYDNRYKYKSIDEMKDGYDAVFTCLPSGVLPRYLELLHDKTKVIFNVSGDYRITNEEISREYYPDTNWGINNIKNNTQYFIPEFQDIQKNKKIINLPGCMAVATIYALYPLIKESLIDTSNIVLDVKTGSSGAGKNTSETHAERFGNFRAHKFFNHKHKPEIEMFFNESMDSELSILFSTYSLDIPRGIYSSAYTKLKDGVNEIDVRKAFFQTYKDKTFVKYINNIKNINIKNTIGTNMAYTSCMVEENKCISVATIDNLMKGAAGQTLQAANLYFDFPEYMGLDFQKGSLWP